MELMHQPFTGQLGSRLIDLLDSQDYDTLNIVVAFAKNSGVLRIKDSLEKFRGRGGKVNVYVGVDLGVTSYEALTVLLLHTDSLNVVHSEKSQTFHSKIYQFSGKEKGLIVVGSHNLTGGGLWTNFESSVLIPVDRSSTNGKRMLADHDSYIRELTALNSSFMTIGAQDDIDKLLQNGYVSKEVSQEVLSAKAAVQDVNGERLFGNGAPAALPCITMPKKERAMDVSEEPASPITVPLSDRYQAIWFETRSMTGGSRNILDLSKKSLVERGDPRGSFFDLGDPKFMRGGVEFFGLKSDDIDKKEDVTLNFEGVDYIGNTILFNNSNGTWRLQIKGVNASKEKITDAFRAKGEAYYLVGKIITFKKIKDDRYSISVFPKSELESFEARSCILARNGSTKNAKRLGLL